MAARRQKVTTEYNEVISAGGVLINEDAKILFCHPTGSSWSRWALPKGRIDEGETYVHAALREVLEETGYNAKILAPLESNVRYLTSGKLGASVMKRLVMFLMAPIEKVQEPDWEHDKFQWVEFDKVELYATERELPLVLEAIEIYSSHK